MHISQSGVALLDTKEFLEIQIVNQYDNYSCLNTHIGEKKCNVGLQVSTLYVRYSAFTLDAHKGLAVLCEMYEHFYSCVRTKKVCKWKSKLD